MRTIAMTCIGCLVATGLIAAEPLDAGRLAAAMLRSAPAAELPAVAALLVKRSQPWERGEAATNVVKIAIRVNSAATPAIVDAVARTAPETAAAVSSTAAREQPSLAPAIATAAIGVISVRASEIVVAVCSAAPAQYRDVAIAAARAAPSCGKDILKAIGSVRPELKPYIDNELAKYRRTQPSVPDCLNQAELAQARAGTTRIGAGTDSRATPRSGPPMIPPGQQGSKPPRGGASPPGGRNYARP